MSTRCCIGYYDKKDKMIHGIYCHHDGYIEGVGLKLLTHYTTLSKVKALIGLGNLSSLGEIPEYRSSHISKELLDSCYSWWVWDLPDRKLVREEAEKYCEGLYEDSGIMMPTEDEMVAPRTFKTIKEFYRGYDHQYYYVYKNKKWYCNGRALRIKSKETK